MPPILYLDANVYDHMVKGYIPQAEVNGLRAALRAGRLTARLSSADLEELLGQWETNRSAALARLRIARDLVGFQGLLKDPTEILREAVEAYAAGSQAPPVTLPEADRRYVVDHLVDVAAGSLRESPLMSEIIDDMRTRKMRLHTRMTEAKALAEKHLGDAVDMRELRKLTFTEYWDAASEGWAERVSTWFDRADDCRRQGWQGLLAVRPVRGVVGATLSLLFSQVVEKTDPDAGDGYDLWHALLASTADVFITRDGRLARRLSRIPMDDFRVVTSISPLLTL